MSARALVALLGLRCSGKTSVGRALAAALGRRFVDLDAETLAAGRQAGWHASSAGELLQSTGITIFRELEAVALRRTVEPEPRIVLATGGGVVEREDNRVWLARTARCVWLVVPDEVLASRMRADPTPRPALLGGGDAVAEIETLRARREPLYRTLAEITIDCGADPVDALVPRIVAALAT